MVKRRGSEPNYEPPQRRDEHASAVARQTRRPDWPVRTQKEESMSCSYGPGFLTVIVVATGIEMRAHQPAAYVLTSTELAHAGSPGPPETSEFSLIVVAPLNYAKPTSRPMPSLGSIVSRPRQCFPVCHPIFAHAVPAIVGGSGIDQQLLTFLQVRNLGRREASGAVSSSGTTPPSTKALLRG
ncbi:hypothetical protein GQ53DRAFT_768296 [Thozetella sp. PMI_491]|nr:hypothetical protein GQ53DRAFT_768296 [Thozetella sp. PMI_491]